MIIKMEKEKTNKKNHWTGTKVNEATKKISEEIYHRNRQAPIQLKLDDLAIFINDKITRRGIAKGLVFVQEDLNKQILEIEKITLNALFEQNPRVQYKYLLDVKKIMQIELWTDVRFLMINKAITPGEITELIRMQMEIDKDINRWLLAMEKAISAEG